MQVVVPGHEKDVEAIANEITHYLSSNPDASDTLDGIVTWWIQRQRHLEAPSLVEAALRHLVEQGRVEQQQTSSGAVVYRKKS